MDITITKDEGLSKSLDVKLNGFLLTDRINAKLAKLANEAKLPGFRKGKVPPKVLKQHYGKSVMGEVLEEIISNSSQQALEKENIRPASQPKISVKTFEEGKDIEFTIEVEQMPEVPELNTDVISLEKIIVEINDEDIKEALERIQGQFKNFEPKAKDKAAESGDAVKIDYLGKKDGEPFDGGKAEGHQLELGSNTFIPGFEEQLIGAKAGDSKVINVTFPEQYHSEDLAGKDVTFDVTVHEVLESKPQELTDELAQQLGTTDLKDLKEKIKQQLENDYSEMTRNFSKRNLLDELDKVANFEVPPKMLEDEFNTLWESAQAENEQKPGFFDKPEKEMKEEYKVVAERRVRLGILLAEIGRKENFEISQKDIEMAIAREAANYPGQEKAIYEYYNKHPEARSKFSGAILEEKVVDFLFDKVKTEEKRMTTKEWWRLANADNGNTNETDSEKKAS